MVKGGRPTGVQEKLRSPERSSSRQFRTCTSHQLSTPPLFSPHSLHEQLVNTTLGLIWAKQTCERAEVRRGRGTACLDRGGRLLCVS